jgi:hypothetical protein
MTIVNIHFEGDRPGTRDRILREDDGTSAAGASEAPKASSVPLPDCEV